MGNDVSAKRLSLYEGEEHMQQRGEQYEISGLFIAQHEKIPQLKSDLTFASSVSYKKCFPCKARRACFKEACGCHVFQKMCLSIQL